MKCPGCFKDFDDQFEFCPHCGLKKSGGPVDRGAARPEPPAAVGATPPQAPPPATGFRETSTSGPTRVPEEGPPKPRLAPPTSRGSGAEKKSIIAERWRGLSARGKAIVVGAGILFLIVVIVAAVTGGEKKSRVNVTEKEETKVTTTTGTEEEEPERTVDDLVSITNVTEGQELTVGPSVIAGTAHEDGCTITCNGQPVGFAPGTRDFAPTVEIAEGPNTITFVVADAHNETYTKTVHLTGVLSPETYKAVSPDGPPFAQLDKNPDGYMGTRCKYRGKVVQIMESYGTTDIRMDITPMGYGIWTDTIYVTFEGTTPAVEDSIIVVYGTIEGSHTYTSQANYEITLPLVKAKYVDVVQ